MDNLMKLEAMTPLDVRNWLIVVFGCWALSLLIFWLFYALCNLPAGLAMRIGYTFGLIGFFEGFYLFHLKIPVGLLFPGGSTTATPIQVAFAVVVMSLPFIWLALIWLWWPRPRRALASL
jgi:hypothetical protein